jgi:preprotein translocase subunit YajC
VKQLPMPASSPSSTTPCWTAVCLAQAEAAGDKAAPPPLFQFLPLVAIGIAAYLLLFRPERERMKRQQSMLGSLKKNDRVVTSGGIYGTVAAVDRDSDRVTLRVDDSANVKLTVTLSSIARVVGGEDSGTTAGS